MEFMASEEELRADPFVGQEYSDDMKNRSWLDRLGRRTPSVSDFYIRPDMIAKKKGQKPIEGALVFVERKAGIDTSVWDKATIHYISADDSVEKGQGTEETSDDSVPF